MLQSYLSFTIITLATLWMFNGKDWPGVSMIIADGLNYSKIVAMERKKNDLYSLHALGLIYTHMNSCIWRGNNYYVSEILKVFNNLIRANCLGHLGGCCLRLRS